MTEQDKADANDCLDQIANICKELRQRTGVEVTGVKIEWEKDYMKSIFLEVEQWQTK